MQQVKSGDFNGMNEEQIKKLVQRKNVELVSHGEVKGVMTRKPETIPEEAPEMKISVFKKKSKILAVPPLKVFSKKGSTVLGGEKKELLFYYV